MKREWFLGAIAGAIALSLAGCASLQAEDARATERMLAAAGFRQKAANTPEKAAHLQALAPGKIVRRERNGESHYVYADHNVCHCIYVGTEPQYQQYRKLVREQTMADEAKVVADESSDPRRWGFWPVP
jgi:hypothetical protein